MTASHTILIDAGEAQVEAMLRGGPGPLVVMIPAGGRAAPDFADLSRALAADGWRTAALNLRGAGNSRGPLANINLHTYAADVAAVIKALAGAPAVVVGHAFGNRVARCLAADRPAMVRCLVLLAAGGKVPAAPESAAAVKMLRAGAAAGDARAALKTAFFAAGSDPSAWEQDFWPAALEANRRAAAATPLQDWWSGGRAPILVIQGRQDRCAPPANAYLLKEEFGDRITVVELDQAAHALLPEQPQAIAEAVLAYLRNYRNQPYME